MIDTRTRALAVTAVLTLIFVATALPAGDLTRHRWGVDLVMLGLNTLPLLLVHRYPLPAVLILSAAYPLWLETGHDAHIFQSLPTLVALYALGSWTPAAAVGRQARPGRTGRPAPGTDPAPLALRAVGLVAPLFMLGAVLSGWWAGADLVEIGYIAVMFALAWALGAVVAARRSYTLRLEEKTAALEAARQELADRAVADERARIARELHDVVAHAMSVITVRAGVGAHLIDSRPAEAASALAVIERTGREALREMRRMLAVLRDPDPRAPRPEPQPGLAELPDLLAQVGAAGTEVSLTVEGATAPLPAGLDLAAYRIIQEALTNVVKHAPGSRASVTVRYRPEDLWVEVRNPGRYAEPVTPGLGMRGMAERVALYDGELTAGPGPDGFQVLARFPRGEPATGGAREGAPT